MQQTRVRRERRDAADAHADLLFGDLARAQRLQRLDRDLARARRVRAQQRVALQPFGLGQRVIGRHRPHDIAGDDARLAQPAGAVPASVVELETGLQTGLQQGIAPVDEKLVAARAQRDVRGHDLQHVIHDRQGIGGFGGENFGEAALDRGGQLRKVGIGGRGGELVDAALRGHDERVIALQVPADVGQFLALREESLRHHRLARQHVLQHAPSERLLLEPRDALERAGLLEAEVGVKRAEARRGDQSVRRREPALADLLLQHAARDADEARGAGQGEPLRHASLPRGPRSGSRDAVVIACAVKEPRRRDVVDESATLVQHVVA